MVLRLTGVVVLWAMEKKPETWLDFLSFLFYTACINFFLLFSFSVLEKRDLAI